VRTTAGEIRKRIAQYYHEPGRTSEIRIELPSGSYVPEFHWPALKVVVNESADVPIRKNQRPYWAAGFAAGALVLLIVAGSRPRAGESSSDQFWAPVFGSSNSVLFCLGTPPAAHEAKPLDFNAITLGAAHQNLTNTVGLGDAVTLARLTSLVGARHKTFTVRNEFNSTLDDLRGNPAILIGAFNNEWTLRLTTGMRFTFEKDPDKFVYRIKDNQNGSASWGLDMNMLAKNQTADYALVSRVYDSTTQRMVVVVAGIGQIGTIAAGEFLSDPRYMDALAGRAPKDWEHKNVQVVLTAEVIDGHSGPPRIVTAYFW
jgi:hypothetical protein